MVSLFQGPVQNQSMSLEGAHDLWDDGASQMPVSRYPVGNGGNLGYGHEALAQQHGQQQPSMGDDDEMWDDDGPLTKTATPVRFALNSVPMANLFSHLAFPLIDFIVHLKFPLQPRKAALPVPRKYYSPVRPRVLNDEMWNEVNNAKFA